MLIPLLDEGGIGWTGATSLDAFADRLVLVLTFRLAGSQTFCVCHYATTRTKGGLQENPQMVNNTGMTERPDYSDIGQRLGKIREGFSELSQKEWARRHNFSPTQYNNWEKGARRISIDAAEALVERYGLSLDFIYLGRMDGLSETARRIL